MSNVNKKKLIVIGAGPGGYSAAFMAADQGMDVTLIDDNSKPGGVCLHRGCIPSKSLLHIAKLIDEAQSAQELGLKFNAPEINLNRIRDWNNEIIRKMSNGLVALCKQRGINFFNGRAKFLDEKHLACANDERISFDYCVIATGSQPICPSLFSDLGERILDSTTALKLECIPERLLIDGGGYIGLEMGTVYSALGSKVTMVEMAETLLAGMDRDLVRPLMAKLKTKFENIYLNTKVKSCEVKKEKVEVGFEGSEDKKPETYDRILIAVGRKPNSKNMGLENTKILTDENGFIKVDTNFQTAESSIFAIGDVIGGAMLAHKASSEGKAIIEYLVNGNKGFKANCIPAVVFTDPELAWCGLTETEANETNRNIKIAKFPWGASGRAQTLGRQDGLTKLVVDPDTDKILGVGISGVGAGDLIAEGVLAIDNKMQANDLAASIHAHPTLSETIMESAEIVYGKSTHIYKRARK